MQLDQQVHMKASAYEGNEPCWRFVPRSHSEQYYGFVFNL
jgi:hypothetical protein